MLDKQSRVPYSDEAFRTSLRDWLSTNIPDEWRHQGDGVTDRRTSEIRRAAGRLLGEAGWLSLAWPAEFGGADADASRRLCVLEELNRIGAPEPMNANALGIFAPTLIRFGTAEQCRRFLPDMVEHRAIWCQGFSEPGAGSDLAAITTRGRLTGEQLVITGQKVWTSYAHLADHCYLLVRTEPGSERHRGLSIVVLPMHQPGVVVRPLRNMVGTEEFCEVFLDGARAPAENVIGQPGQGWQMAMFALSKERSVGLAQRSLKLSREFNHLTDLLVQQREEGNPRATDDFVKGELVDAYVRMRAVAATVATALEKDERGEDLGSIAPVAKVSWSEGHQRQLNLAKRLLGPSFALSNGPGHSWFRAAMFARAETIYGGTSQIQRNIVADLVGLPR